jgi:hypothetical protein
MSFLGSLEAEVQHQIVENRFQFHQSESRSNAVSRPDSEWHVCIWIDFFAIFFIESFGIKLFRVWEIIGIVMEAVNWNSKVVVLREMESLVVKLQVVVLGASSFCDLQEDN